MKHEAKANPHPLPAHEIFIYKYVKYIEEHIYIYIHIRMYGCSLGFRRRKPKHFLYAFASYDPFALSPRVFLQTKPCDVLILRQQAGGGGLGVQDWNPSGEPTSRDTGFPF